MMQSLNRKFSLHIVSIAFGLGAGIAVAQVQPSPENLEFFEKRVRPTLVNRCYACHSAATKPAGGLRVDDRNGLLNGGDSGPAIIPGDPQKSLLLARVQHENPKRRMPKEGDLLTKAEIDDLVTWIRNGVAWPAERVPESLGKPKLSYDRLRAKHWSFQPLKVVLPPSVKASSWAKTDIDHFILAKLEENQLTPVPDADRRTLVRRVTYDLTGLPPTSAEIDAFVNDKSVDAYEKVIDRLLRSTEFGEKWGRHWLDVARYGESSGPSRNIPYPHAWRYRDYVIDAVNRDIPFNRFLQEQIAGDLLTATSSAERDRLLIATGFLALGPKDVNQRFKERFEMDNVDEKIDTVTRSTLALTVSCARCHDHKFDPIPTTDYYALAGIFTSTHDRTGVRSKMGGAGLDYYDPAALANLSSVPPVQRTDKIVKLESEVAVAKKVWDEIRGTPEGLRLGPNGRPKQQPFRLEYERLQAELLFLTDPGSRGYGVHAVHEGKRIGDTAVRIRGEAERLGPVVPRGFLTAVNVPDTSSVNPLGSGRLQLAEWLTNSRNPLTQRVITNRVWQHLFGRGIVKTVDNFGIAGDRPSHPELLDYLADDFVRNGWSVKALVRKIVLSHTYQLGSGATPVHKEIDPENRWVWRHSPRRLQAEEIRDTMLATAGRLELHAPAVSPVSGLRMVEMRDNGPESRAVHEEADRSLSRSIYLPLLRGVTPHSLEAFDPVTQTLVTGDRDATTVPVQALFLLNSAFVRKQALSLAEKLLAEPQENRTSRITAAYRLTLGRAPNAKELIRARKFLSEYESAYLKLPAPSSPVVQRPPNANLKNAVSFTLPADPDNIERADEAEVEELVQPPTAASAAWMGFVQALFGSAEFRFVR